MEVSYDIHEEISELLYYAELVARRGYICNQLGNLAKRSVTHLKNDQLILTKHRGISLEEMQFNHVIGISLQNDQLIHGDIPPSIGHRLNKEIFKHRADVNAVIHVHVDELIAYFSMFYEKPFNFISADAALVLGSAPVILPPELNVEIDASMAHKFIKDTNTLILANHGVTTFGTTLSQAYHRLNTMVAEIRRLLCAMHVSVYANTPVNYLSKNEELKLYKLSKDIL